MAKRTYILMGVLVLLAGALLASAVLAQEPDSPPTAEEGETYPEEAVRDQLDEDGKIVTTDDRLAKVAKDHSGGFGGYYFDKTVEGQVFVFMTDPSQTNAARDAFQAAYKGNRTVTQITPIKGEYAFDDLLTWFRTLDRAMLADGIYPSAGAAREIQNRIWFALEDIGQVDTILELMRSLEIPEGAVIFEEAHSELLSGEDDVQSKWRPLVGGVKFQIKFGQPYCTVGFMTERGGVNGLVTASHCNNDDDDHPNGGIGGNEDANIFQPIRHLFLNNKIAEAEVDPSLGAMNHPDCPEDYVCRYSDAAFAELISGQDMDKGHIAQPEALTETEVDPAGTIFEVTNESSGVSDDEIVHYVGATTGWRSGEVYDDCGYSTTGPPLGGRMAYGSSAWDKL